MEDVIEEKREMTEQELQEKKDEMLKFYTESMPYLEAQFEYEKLLMKIDKVRFQRTSIQVQYAMMMNPGEEMPEDFNPEEMTPPPAEEPTPAKKRTLKKK